MANHIDRVAAFISADLQHATFSIPSALDMTTVVANAARLAAAFRERGLPVVLVRPI